MTGAIAAAAVAALGVAAACGPARRRRGSARAARRRRRLRADADRRPARSRRGRAADRGASPGRPTCSAAFDEPLLVVRDRRVLIANQAARALLGAHIEGSDVRLAIRHPAAAEHLAGDGGDGAGADRAGRARRARPALGDDRRAAARRQPPGPPRRPEPGPRRRADAGRFRRQCQPRTAHPARHPARLHRDAAGRGRGRPRDPRSASSRSCPARRRGCATCSTI